MFGNADFSLPTAFQVEQKYTRKFSERFQVEQKNTRKLSERFQVEKKNTRNQKRIQYVGSLAIILGSKHNPVCVNENEAFILYRRWSEVLSNKIAESTDFNYSHQHKPTADEQGYQTSLFGDSNKHILYPKVCTDSFAIELETGGKDAISLSHSTLGQQSRNSDEQDFHCRVITE